MKTPEEISYEYEINNAFKFKSKRQVFLDGYNRALKRKFISNSILLLILLSTIVLLTIIFSTIIYNGNL